MGTNRPPGIDRITYTMDGHDRALRQLPPRLRHFVEFEASVPFYLPQLVEMAKWYSEDRLIRSLRGELGELCERVYGPDHPNVKWEPMKSPHRLPPKTRTRLR